MLTSALSRVVALHLLGGVAGDIEVFGVPLSSFHVTIMAQGKGRR